MNTTPILADECIPKDVISALKAAGLTVQTVVQHKLTGATDEEIFAFAQKQHWILLTFDRGFGDIFRFNHQDTAGTVIVLIRDMNKPEISTITTSFFSTYDSLQGKLTIIGKKKIRVVKR